MLALGLRPNSSHTDASNISVHTLWVENPIFPSKEVYFSLWCMDQQRIQSQIIVCVGLDSPKKNEAS